MTDEEAREIRKVQAARKDRPCGMYPCDQTIARGERYLRVALPPRVGVNESDRWWGIDVCRDCVHDDATLAQLDAPRPTHTCVLCSRVGVRGFDDIPSVPEYDIEPTQRCHGRITCARRAHRSIPVHVRARQRHEDIYA